LNHLKNHSPCIHVLLTQQSTKMEVLVSDLDKRSSTLLSSFWKAKTL